MAEKHQAIRLNTGDSAPDFTLPDQDGNSISLHDFSGSPVILFCYPAAMTPGCTTEACDFRDSHKPLLAVGYRILGLSPDGQSKLQKFRDKYEFDYPLLSDPDRKVLAAYGAWGPKTMYGKSLIGVIRSTFVIDESGKIAHALYGVKATGHVGRLRELLGV